METRTLGAALGTSTHLSPLLQKAKRLGLDADALEQLAIDRGCDYYAKPGHARGAPVPESQFSNSELAIALLNPASRYSPQAIRLGAAMLGALGNSAPEICRFAALERCHSLVRYIASAGARFEPQNPFWQELLASLPQVPPPDPSLVPHPTRFVALTGITRGKRGEVAQWIRP